MGHELSVASIWRAEKEGRSASLTFDGDLKKLQFYDKMKALIKDIRIHEGKQYIVINPTVEGRIKVLKHHTQ